MALTEVRCKIFLAGETAAAGSLVCQSVLLGHRFNMTSYTCKLTLYDHWTDLMIMFSFLCHKEKGVLPVSCILSKADACDGMNTKSELERKEVLQRLQKH